MEGQSETSETTPLAVVKKMAMADVRRPENKQGGRSEHEKHNRIFF
jgi:hypothetical protein